MLFIGKLSWHIASLKEFTHLLAPLRRQLRTRRGITGIAHTLPQKRYLQLPDWEKVRHFVKKGYENSLCTLQYRRMVCLSYRDPYQRALMKDVRQLAELIE